jgi:phosphatidylserine/phosphatidylglycerophosphate/cardiolipin synthase-like enzyme
MLVWDAATGWLERFAMGSNRERMLRRLAAADHCGRLRVYKRVVAGDREQEVALHAKLVIVDDEFLRVGSSNLNNRSLGFDTECDLAVEAADAATRTAIAAVRTELLAEHLHCSAAEVRRALEAEGLIGAVERLNRRAGLLQRYRVDPADGAQTPLPGSALLDPGEPIDLDSLRRFLSHQFLAD